MKLENGIIKSMFAGEMEIDDDYISTYIRSTNTKFLKTLILTDADTNKKWPVGWIMLKRFVPYVIYINFGDRVIDIEFIKENDGDNDYWRFNLPLSI